MIIKLSVARNSHELCAWLGTGSLSPLQLGGLWVRDSDRPMGEDFIINYYIRKVVCRSCQGMSNLIFEYFDRGRLFLTGPPNMQY